MFDPGLIFIRVILFVMALILAQCSPKPDDSKAMVEVSCADVVCNKTSNEIRYADVVYCSWDCVAWEDGDRTSAEMVFQLDNNGCYEMIAFETGQNACP